MLVTWRRLGSSAAPILIGTGMIVVGVLVTGGGVIAALLEDWDGPTGVWVALVLLAGGAFIGISCRLLMVGTYAGEQGLRIRTPLRTLDVGWPAILAVRTQKVTRANYNAVYALPVRQVCVDLADGQTIELTIHGVQRGESRPVRIPDILAAAEFDRVVAELRHLTAYYRTGGTP